MSTHSPGHEAKQFSVQVSAVDGESVWVHYHSNQGHEVGAGTEKEGAWHFKAPTPVPSGRQLATVVVKNKRGHVVRASRPIDTARHMSLSESNAGFHHVAPRAAQLAQMLDDHPRVAVSMYWVAAAVLALGAVYSLIRGLQLHEPLRFALAMILVGFASLLVYEAIASARLRGKGMIAEPTIARILGGAFLHHPWLSWVILIGLCMLAGALVIHFTRLNGLQVWTLGVAVVAFGAGAVFGNDRWLRLLQ